MASAIYSTGVVFFFKQEERAKVRVNTAHKINAAKMCLFFIMWLIPFKNYFIVINTTEELFFFKAIPHNELLCSHAAEFFVRQYKLRRQERLLCNEICEV